MGRPSLSPLKDSLSLCTPQEAANSPQSSENGSIELKELFR